MNLRKKLLTFLWTKPSIKWLTEVECLDSKYNASTNQTYIDTDVIHSWDVPMEITATIAKTANNRSIIMGRYPGERTFTIETSDTNRLRLYVTASTGADPTYVLVNQFTPSASAIPLNTPTKIWVRFTPLGDAAHTVNYEMGFETLDGEVKATVSGSFYRDGQPSTARPLRMFFDYRSDTTGFGGGMKIYQLELKSGEKYRKYIPCLDLNGVPCMYEKSTGTLAYNAGTGEFTAGRTITEVDWMRLTGSQRFNTGFIANTLKTTLKTHFTYESTTDAMMMGTRLRASYPESCSFYIPAPNTSFPYSRMREDWTADTSTAVYSASFTSNDHTAELTCGYAKVDGVVSTDTATSDYTMSSPWWFGCVYTIITDTFQYYQVGKIYFVELLDTDTREQYRYCVPAHDENNVGFFFDRVNHFIMDNKGTNTEDMTWGDDIHYVDYLENNGSQYIDTGIKLGSDYGVEIVARNTNSTTGVSRYLFGFATTTNRYMIAIGSASNRFLFDLESSSYRIDASASGYDGQFHTHKIDHRTYYIDGVSQGTSTSTGTFTSTVNSFLFGCAGVARTNSYWQIKQGKIIDENGNVLTNFVPVIKGNDNKPAMFDLVSRTFATNQATGDDFICGNSILGIPEETGLPMGFVPLQYIESNGTQYIMSGISGEARWTGVAQSTATSSKSQCVVAASSVTAKFLASQLGSSKLNWGVTSGTGGYTTIGTTDRAVFDVNFANSLTSGTINNETFSYSPSGTFTEEYSIFNAYSPNNAYFFYGRMFELKCYQNNVLVRDFVPVLRTIDNKPGLYDKVTGQFFTNDGTGEFRYAF